MSDAIMWACRCEPMNLQQGWRKCKLAGSRHFYSQLSNLVYKIILVINDVYIDENRFFFPKAHTLPLCHPLLCASPKTNLFSYTHTSFVTMVIFYKYKCNKPLVMPLVPADIWILYTGVTFVHNYLVFVKKKVTRVIL